MRGEKEKRHRKHSAFAYISEKKKKIDNPDFRPDSDMYIRIQTMSQRVVRIINLIVFSLQFHVS